MVDLLNLKTSLGGGNVTHGGKNAYDWDADTVVLVVATASGRKIAVRHDIGDWKDKGGYAGAAVFEVSSRLALYPLRHFSGEAKGTREPFPVDSRGKGCAS